MPSSERRHRKVVAFLTTLFLIAGPVLAAEPEHLLKVATLAPEGSGWARAVRSLDEQVRVRTGGGVGLRLYPGGVLGDESVTLRKVRIGQLQGVGLTGLGLAEICPDILALEMPFLFADYDEIDYVLTHVAGFYQEALSASGFALLGWTDVGYVNILSRHPIRGVADLQGRRVWQLVREPITEVLFRLARVSAVPLGIPDVLLALQSGLVDVVYAPPAAAVVLQWFTRVRYLTELPVNYTLGALVVDRRAFERLPPEHQTTVREIAAEEMRRLAVRTRQENRDALAAMVNQGVQLVQPEPAEIEGFRRLVDLARPELVGKAFSQAAYDQVARHLAACRGANR
jgi:TRAP-type C4-dicarboxylate transport system substrate-binding protein